MLFLSKLKGSPDADAPLFQSTTPERAATLLMSVVSQGNSPHATAVDWANMHRALDAIVELFTWHREYLKASVFSNFQAQAYVRDEEDYSAALAHSQEAIKLQEQSGQTETLYIPWMNVADDLGRLGRLEEADIALRRAHELATNAPEMDAIIRSKIVQLDVARKNLQAARRDCDDFARAASGAQAALFRARLLLSQSVIALAQKQYDSALNSAKGASAAANGDAHADEFSYEVLNQVLAIALDAMNDVPYQEALALCRRIDHEFGGLPIPATGFVRQIRDHRRRIAGDFDALVREQTAQVEAARARADIPGQISALQMLAVDYAYLNDSSEQLAALEQALALDKTAKPGTISPQLHYSLLSTAGKAYLKQHDLAHARAVFNQILSSLNATQDAALRSELRSTYGDAELGKAAIAAQDDDPDTAREIYSKALQPSGPAARDRFKRSDVLLRDAQFERALNEQPESALRLYQDAIAALHQEHDTGTEIAARLECARFLAVEHPELRGAAETAQANLDVARTQANAILFFDAQWRVEYLQGVLAQNSHRLEDAIQAYRQAVEKLEHVRGSLTNPDLRESIMDEDSVQDLYRRLVALLSARNERDDAWYFLERDKARTFLESLHGRHFQQSGSSPQPSSKHTTSSGRAAELQKLEDQIAETRASLAPDSVSVLRAAGRSPEASAARLKDLEARFTLLRQDRELESDRAVQPLSLQPITLSRLRTILPARTALVEYGLLDGSITAFIATRSRVQQISWNADTRKLPTLLRALRDQMASPAAGSEFPELLSSVSQQLVHPVLHALPAAVNRLIIVPTQSLNYIPFQALLMPNGRPLLDSFTVTYVPSASVLQFLKPVRASETSRQVFLGALGKVSVDGWAPLPGTLREINSIEAVYPGAQQAEDAAFNHQAVVWALQHDTLVHLATHGVFDQDAPLFSAVLVAPSAGQQSRLSLYELLDLRVKAHLVVLSACETNRGRLFGGDEVAGLTRTFLQAGADDVISSLWKVSDDSTALLMATFHRSLRAGASPADALRRAQIQVRARFPQPFYWAAFVNTGIQ